RCLHYGTSCEKKPSLRSFDAAYGCVAHKQLSRATVLIVYGDARNLRHAIVKIIVVVNQLCLVGCNEIGESNRLLPGSIGDDYRAAIQLQNWR
ncbi:hypothetical protein ALC62_13213, partial [Cyphomyrmex costatus]